MHTASIDLIEYGEIQERERITNLLKDEAKRHKKEGLYTAYVYLKDVIALIEEDSK